MVVDHNSVWVDTLILEIDIFKLILQIEVGDVLCEIETDKATVEFESLEEG